MGESVLEGRYNSKVAISQNRVVCSREYIMQSNCSCTMAPMNAAVNPVYSMSDFFIDLKAVFQNMNYNHPHHNKTEFRILQLFAELC